MDKPPAAIDSRGQTRQHPAQPVARGGGARTAPDQPQVGANVCAAAARRPAASGRAEGASCSERGGECGARELKRPSEAAAERTAGTHRDNTARDLATQTSCNEASPGRAVPRKPSRAKRARLPERRGERSARSAGVQGGGALVRASKGGGAERSLRSGDSRPPRSEARAPARKRGGLAVLSLPGPCAGVRQPLPPKRRKRSGVGGTSGATAQG